MHVAYMLQNHHYSHKDFDDAVSTKLLENYFNMLDFRQMWINSVGLTLPPWMTMF